METEKGILWYIFIYVICLTVTILLIKPAVVFSEVYNDAYSYEDSFEDLSGLNLFETSGFEVSGGALQAIMSPAVVVSECISLPQPTGGTFQGWSFLRIGVNDLGAGSNTLEIQDCSGTPLLLISDVPEGESAIDLSGITASAIRLMWTVNQIGAKLNFWGIYGTADGATCIEIAPDSDMVNAGATVTFTITLSTSGAMVRNPVLRFSIDDINGLHTPSVDDGLAEDAEVDYGNGVITCRPLEFVSAGNGPNGETPSKPGHGSTSGEVVWSLGDLSDGFLDNISVTMRVPKGYINDKTLAARAVLEHGMSSGGYTNSMSEEVTSSLVTVDSVHYSDQFSYSNFGNVGPGATNIYDMYYFPRGNSIQPENPSDIEDITVTITEAGTCTPLFRDVFAGCEYSYQVVSAPQVGAPISSDSPVIVHLDRASFDYNYNFNMRILIYYDIPYFCDGNTIGTQAVIAAGKPSWFDTDDKDHPITLETCRRGYNSHVHRVMSGNDTGSHIFWPGWTEYYISFTIHNETYNGSLRAGEYFTTWNPYGNEGHRAHTVTLDHSYNLIEIPNGITFHGVRQTNNLSRLYKDSTGTAPVPTDPAFDHNADPPHPAWKQVDITWNGNPFSNPQDDNDPRAVAISGCRLLGVKDNDNPAWQGPDYGNWSPLFFWRVCDGSYGCTELPEGTAMSLIGGTIFTYETTTDPGTAHECFTSGGWTIYKESKSWPKVYTWPEENQVPAGRVAHIIMNPENQNFASQWVEGRWVVNLYEIREHIDLAGITGEVLTEGLSIPAPDQNVLGESCDIANNITFHFPDPSGCSSATSEEDDACMAWWEVPAPCQPPNGWGYQIHGDLSHDHYIQMYRFRLNVPILNTTPADTVLDFVSEVRTNNLGERGADNAVDPERWSSGNYAATTSVTVLEMPGLDVEKAGPFAKKPGDTVTYTLEVTNYGNTPNDGWYLVDWLPKDSVNSTEFTPEYGKVYVNENPNEILVEYSIDAGCFTDPLGCAWTAMALQATSRVGYQTETVSNINPGATCVRVRRNPLTTKHFYPGDTILAAIDVVIPNDVSLLGKRLYNRALTGAATVFNAPSEVPPVETINVRTKVSSEVFVDVVKTFEIDPTRAGWIKWMLRMHNTSGVKAVNINVVDELPNEIIYEGLEDPLPTGWGWLEEPDIPSIGGKLHLMINELNPDDGNPGAGGDEGSIAFWSRALQDTPCGTLISNCATATPESGTGGESCVSTTIPCLEVNKSQAYNGQIFSDMIIDVSPGDEIKYKITLKNNLEHAVSLEIYDELDMYVDYIAGTFKVNGAAASDFYISDGVLNYEYPVMVSPGETLTLILDVMVKGGDYLDWTIGNTAQILACIDPLDPLSCFLSIDTPTVYAIAICDETDNDSDGFTICDMDCDDADPNTYPGAQELCDGKDNDCDNVIPADESDDDNDEFMGCEGDCNDDDSTIYPNAPEIIDGKDNDCNGKIDDGECIVKMDLVGKWNIASLPVLPQSSLISDIFPEAKVLYTYEKGSGYIRVRSHEEMELDIGYWVLLPEAISLELSGECVTEYTLQVENGWYMIGSCSAPAQALVDIGSIVVIYRYDPGSGYKRVLATEKLEPGTGYWILLNNIPVQATLRVEGI